MDIKISIYYSYSQPLPLICFSFLQLSFDLFLHRKYMHFFKHWFYQLEVRRSVNMISFYNLFLNIDFNNLPTFFINGRTLMVHVIWISFVT